MNERTETMNNNLLNCRPGRKIRREERVTTYRPARQYHVKTYRVTLAGDMIDTVQAHDLWEAFTAMQCRYSMPVRSGIYQNGRSLSGIIGDASFRIEEVA